MDWTGSIFPATSAIGGETKNRYRSVELELVAQTVVVQEYNSEWASSFYCAEKVLYESDPSYDNDTSQVFIRIDLSRAARLEKSH